MTFDDALKSIQKADEGAKQSARERWLNIAKPLFSLGKLEDYIIKIAGIKRNADFELNKKALVIMCADNGVIEEGITQSTSEITSAVAANFIRKRASVCIMAESADIDVFPIDVGMKDDIGGIERHKTANGTKNMTKGSAMTRQQAIFAVQVGINKVSELKQKGYDIILTGEMGIGNTATSTAVMCTLLGLEPEKAAGKGAGLSDDGLKRKINAVKKAIDINNPDKNDVIDVVSKVGGFDIAALTGVFIGGAVYGIPIVADGIISNTAAYCAVKLNTYVRDYIIGSHISKEPLGRILYENMGIDAVIDAGMFLGEGSGAVAVLPIIQMAYDVYKKMPTFQTWGASEVYRIL